MPSNKNSISREGTGGINPVTAQECCVCATCISGRSVLLPSPVTDHLQGGHDDSISLLGQGGHDDSISLLGQGGHDDSISLLGQGGHDDSISLLGQGGHDDSISLLGQGGHDDSISLLGQHLYSITYATLTP